MQSYPSRTRLHPTAGEGRGAPHLPSPPAPVVGWFRMRLRMIVHGSGICPYGIATGRSARMRLGAHPTQGSQLLEGGCRSRLRVHVEVHRDDLQPVRVPHRSVVHDVDDALVLRHRHRTQSTVPRHSLCRQDVRVLVRLVSALACTHKPTTTGTSETAVRHTRFLAVHIAPDIAK